MRINQNIMALNAYRNLSNNEMGLSKSLEKLSSGTRINRAADDASGLVISQGLRAQIGGLNQATRNAQDGISVVQTAEGALNEVANMLGRMRDLAVQASNTGANDTAGRTAAQKEVDELSTEINRVADTTKFGSTKLLDGNYGTKAALAQGVTTVDLTATGAGIAATTGAAASIAIFTDATNDLGSATGDITAVAAGTSAADAAASLQKDYRAMLANGTSAQKDFASRLTVTASGPTATTVFAVHIDGIGAGGSVTFAGSGVTDVATATVVASTGGTFQVGANSIANQDTINVNISDTHTTTLLGAAPLDLVAASGTAITQIDAAIATVSDTRAQIGAKQNRFESVISNLQVSTENLSSSESRIRDTDYASEMVKFTRGQILNQAATSMLGQANKLPQSVLSLLQG